VLLGVDIMVAKVSFRFNSPMDALKMNFRQLKYFYGWCKIADKQERDI